MGILFQIRIQNFIALEKTELKSFQWHIDHICNNLPLIFYALGNKSNIILHVLLSLYFLSAIYLVISYI